MSDSARVITIALASIAAVLVAGVLAVYGISAWKLRRHYEAPLIPLRVNAALDIVEGERMARIVGCWDGCHGSTGQGGYMEIDGIVRNSAPTLSQVVPRYSDDELVRLVRYGVKRDGRSAIGMNSYSLWALGDQDLANIIAHLRGQPAASPIERELELTLRGRLGLATGSWSVSAEQVDRSRPRWGDAPQRTAVERGQYLASITCSECHGLDYNGDPLEGAPSLAIVRAYSLEQFRHLMRTAEPIGERRLDEDMRWVAKAPFTDEEVAGLYQFLRARYEGAR